ncbi:hypothetical protein [Acinetobacter larvae]|uniref:Uncharacterized protein n=1 Tax=Acinetobacter larvae TaxID=1789224 RepID=A0A1B2M125_9GAMM|nr:hypothetical protein [Acinetobacter larvae]AOA58902.1 hypothetical protein BFG52_11420 [Acinetobacter larvae]
MKAYYPYVVLKTNVDIKYLKYSFQIYNSVTNKVVSSFPLPPKLPTSNNFKKVGANLYKTEHIKLDNTQINEKSIGDYVINFKLYKLSLSGKELLVWDSVIPERVDNYSTPAFNAAIKPVEFNTTTFPTQVVLDGDLKNTIELSLNKNRIFQCIDPGCRPGEPKDPFTKKQIEAGLQARLNNPFPVQDRTSLCGPAAYFFCLVNLSPSSYKMAVKRLWETGKADIGKLSIKPFNDGCRRVRNFYNKNGQPKIPPIDWITLASLRESENILLKLNDPDQEIAGITTWGDLFNWFKKSNFRGLKKYPFYGNGYNTILIDEINKYAGQDYYVVSLISASILRGGGSSGTKLPDHWIVWTDQLRDTQGIPIKALTEPFNTKVKLKMFSWGDHEQLLKDDISYYKFMKNLFFSFIVKKENF